MATPLLDALIADTKERYLRIDYPDVQTLQEAGQVGLNLCCPDFERGKLLGELANYHFDVPHKLIQHLQDGSANGVGHIISLLLFEIFIQELLKDEEVATMAKERGDEYLASKNPDLDSTIDDLGLSEEVVKKLLAGHILTVRQLTNRTEDQLLAIKDFGQRSLDEVIGKLEAHGLSLKPS